MTKEDKAEEIMNLVKQYTKETLNYYGWENGQSTAQSMNEAWVRIHTRLYDFLENMNET